MRTRDTNKHIHAHHRKKPTGPCSSASFDLLALELYIHYRREGSGSFNLDIRWLPVTVFETDIINQNTNGKISCVTAGRGLFAHKEREWQHLYKWETNNLFSSCFHLEAWASNCLYSFGYTVKDGLSPMAKYSWVLVFKSSNIYTIKILNFALVSLLDSKKTPKFSITAFKICQMMTRSKSRMQIIVFVHLKGHGVDKFLHN